MAFEFHLPDIGEGVIEGEVVRWKVAEGDDIELDQPMVEVQTDKATVEIPSPRKGKVAKINYRAGEICPVGNVLVVIDAPGGAPVTVAAAATTPAAAVAPARAGGGNGAHAAAEAATAARPVLPAARPEVVDATSAQARPLASPATRRLARELGVDLAQVTSSGKGGRVTSEDVRAFAEQPQATASRPTTAPTPAATALARPARAPITLAPGEREERIPLRGVRRKIAENMTLSKFTATHFTYVEEVDMTDLVEVRTRAKVKAAERGVRLTYLPFIVKAIVAGLKKWPALNASLDEARQEIVRKLYYHIGIAAQGPAGLVVTVVHDADTLSILQLASEIQRLAEAVESGAVKREELVGSTFTISSLGALGGVLATPIINFPEVGIVGVHKLSQRPAVVAGQVVPRWLMNLSLSLDHRLVDGWDGAMFLQEVKTLLEDPTLMFMEMV
jgi:pyruvate dehydrogenase E2 component (dihydrolipoamide acetyltransferase)